MKRWLWPHKHEDPGSMSKGQALCMYIPVICEPERQKQADPWGLLASQKSVHSKFNKRPVLPSPKQSLFVFIHLLLLRFCGCRNKSVSTNISKREMERRSEERKSHEGKSRKKDVLV